MTFDDLVTEMEGYPSLHSLRFSQEPKVWMGYRTSLMSQRCMYQKWWSRFIEFKKLQTQSWDYPWDEGTVWDYQELLEWMASNKYVEKHDLDYVPDHFDTSEYWLSRHKGNSKKISGLSVFLNLGCNDLSLGSLGHKCFPKLITGKIHCDMCNYQFKPETLPMTILGGEDPPEMSIHGVHGVPEIAIEASFIHRNYATRPRDPQKFAIADFVHQKAIMCPKCRGDFVKVCKQKDWLTYDPLSVDLWLSHRLEQNARNRRSVWKRFFRFDDERPSEPLWKQDLEANQKRFGTPDCLTDNLKDMYRGLISHYCSLYAKCDR